MINILGVTTCYSSADVVPTQPQTWYRPAGCAVALPTDLAHRNRFQPDPPAGYILNAAFRPQSVYFSLLCQWMPPQAEESFINECELWRCFLSVKKSSVPTHCHHLRNELKKDNTWTPKRVEAGWIFKQIYQKSCHKPTQWPWIPPEGIPLESHLLELSVLLFENSRGLISLKPLIHEQKDKIHRQGIP